ncbi:MAG: DUF1638 domain-containing protein [Hyphomicrobiales bacterium]
MDLSPADDFDFKRGSGDVLLIACGALAREIVQLIELNGWTHLDVACLPAKWHNTPEKIPGGVREKIKAAKEKYRKICCVYADCGTGGLLDKVLEEEGVERIGGPHCYSFFMGNEAFDAKWDEDFTAFFLTDYLARHFDKLVWEGFGIAKHPELRDMYFANYTKLIYLAQAPTDELRAAAESAAERLGLDYEYRETGFGDLSAFMEEAR